MINSADCCFHLHEKVSTNNTNLSHLSMANILYAHQNVYHVCLNFILAHSGNTWRIEFKYCNCFRVPQQKQVLEQKEKSLQRNQPPHQKVKVIWNCISHSVQLRIKIFLH